MIKTLIVVGNEYFVNGIQHFSVKNMDLYLVYIDDIANSRDSALSIMNKNNVLFISSLSALKIADGSYILGDQGVTIHKSRCSISARVDTHRSLWSALRIKFPLFTSEFYLRVMWNNILHFLHYISFLIILLWIVVYLNFELIPVNLAERQALITSLYS